MSCHEEVTTASPSQQSTERPIPDEEPSKEQSASTTRSLAFALPCAVVIFALLISGHKSSLRPVAESSIPQQPHEPPTANETTCYATCRLRVAESIPMGLVFGPPALSTYEAWAQLIKTASKDVVIAAYKSSLQGKHVLGQELSEIYSHEGDSIYALLRKRGEGASNVSISMVENYPPKDKGDNEDGMLLQEEGSVNRRYLTIANIMKRGKMHSKFLLADSKTFYLGSANLDWRSLNQKFELGVFVEDCPCLGEDLRRIYDAYWMLSYGFTPAEIRSTPALYNAESPMRIAINEEPSAVYIASSPPALNNEGRTHDLVAVLNTINSAKQFLYFHVMDYFPLFVYRKPQEHWPLIDDAIRAAILRGVEVKILTAALHYPRQIASFLRSLQALDKATGHVSVEAKIMKVPAPEGATIVIARERRTHKKLLVTEDTVVIGNSNWSGDYFEGGTTGAAVIIQQNGEKKQLVAEMKANFQRDFNSIYAHPVEEYYNKCIIDHSADFCETKKDPSLFADKH